MIRTKKHVLIRNALRWVVVLGFLPAFSVADKVDDLSQKVEELTKKNISIENKLKQLEKNSPAANAPNKSITIETHGYVKADLIHDFGQKSGDRTNYATLPESGDLYSEGHTRLHARQSRLNVSAKKDTKFGPLKAVIEVDFYGGGTNSPSGSEVISNSANLRLRHAYVKFGKWSFGQMWSNYVDVKTFPQNLDFSNDTGQAFLRQSQIRYTRPIGNTLFSFSIENPEADFIDDAGDKRSNLRDVMPDITARILYKQDWGHISAQSVFRRFGVDDGEYDDSDIGYGIGVSGKIKVTKNDFVRFHFSSGDGIGRYIQEAAHSAAAVKNPGTALVSIKTQSALGGYLGLQHWWTPTWRSNLNAGFVQKDWDRDQLGETVADSQIEKLNSYHLNLIWRALTALDLGIELSRAKQTLEGGSSGDINRFQMSTTFKF